MKVSIVYSCIQYMYSYFQMCRATRVLHVHVGLHALALALLYCTGCTSVRVYVYSTLYCTFVHELYSTCYDLASYVLHVLPYQLIRRTAATVILISRGSEETNRCSRGSVFPFKTCFSSLLLRVLVFVCNIDYPQHWRCRIKFLRHSLCPLTVVGF